MKGMLVTVKTNGETLVQPLNKAVTLETIKEAIGGGYIELVPGFDTVVINGKTKNCVAFCDEEGKLNGLPFNATATVFWDHALMAKGNSLDNGKGGYHDVLVGDIAIIYGDKQLMETV